MKLKVANGADELDVSDESFGAPFNEPLVHQVITAYRNAGRAGTKAQKTRTEVRGGGRKPWNQKGTGQARAGSNRSPIWVGGGRAFAAKPRDFAQKVNRKMYRGALRSILGELVRSERLVVTSELSVGEAKTKQLVEKLKSLSLGGERERTLLVVEAQEDKLFLAARNLPRVTILPASAIDPVSLANHDKVLMTVGAVKMIEERLQ